MFQNLTGWHLIIILAIILLLFGAPKLPGLAKSIAQSMRIFKTEIAEDRKPTVDDDLQARGTGTTARPVDDPTVRSTTSGDIPPKS
ncbi:twin-arginine translocase TatA/TatE family subunit [Frigoribacterium sp. 2-23]|uniref:twin-arginine translocase TatA/TatE family subunit n=1 Tax=Frigoribacterium sp. 2-23 TaxID=3415006 RepID=UPI003C6FFDB2